MLSLSGSKVPNAHSIVDVVFPLEITCPVAVARSLSASANLARQLVVHPPERLEPEGTGVAKSAFDAPGIEPAGSRKVWLANETLLQTIVRQRDSG